MTGYFSFREQTLHYFTRPHDAAPTTAIAAAAAWRGRDIANDPAWRTTFTGDEVTELDTALETAKKTGKSTADLTTGDFPLPSLSARIAKWRNEISNGRGFQVIGGAPVERWGDEDAGLFFWCFGLHLGVPGAQNPQNDLLGHVTDTGDDAGDPFVRLYRTASDIQYHCDAADVVGLLCLRAAKSGGASRIASSVAVFNEVLARASDLAPRLFEPFNLDGRNESKDDSPGYTPIPPCRYATGQLRTFYHSDYFRSVTRHADVPQITDDEWRLLDLYEEIANDPAFRLDMHLTPGDIQLLSNHTILHARTDYEDWPDPERKRHLLRLWLSLNVDQNQQNGTNS
jgi:hypothetical protein